MFALKFPDLSRLSIDGLIQAAVKFELYVIVIACVIAICIMSLAAAIFIVKTALHHAFPGFLPWAAERLRSKSEKPSPAGTVVLADAAKRAG